MPSNASKQSTSSTSENGLFTNSAAYSQYSQAVMNTALNQINMMHGNSSNAADTHSEKAQIKAEMHASLSNARQQAPSMAALQGPSVAETIQANYMANVASLGLSQQQLEAMNDPKSMSDSQKQMFAFLENLPAGPAQPADPYAQAQADMLKHLERSPLSAGSSLASLVSQSQALDPVQAMNANLESKGIRLNG